MDTKYRDFFEIDEEYFPQINDSSIAAASSDFWTKTYPHETFIDMLISTEKVLSRQEKRSIWIEGAYGTGKSQCAYALKKVLEVSEIELRDYWNRYEPLKKKNDLLEKIIGHKQKGIVTAYRYASGGIGSTRELFLAVQESVKKALEEKKLYTGENTLRESVIAWIDKPANKNWLDELLRTEYSSLFSQSNAEEILISLKKGREIKKLMDNIFLLADKEGITALNIDADRLISWLTDIIDKNNIKIVFIWDEFSDYFKNNRESLSEFQKLAELVNLKPFYFIVVTHESGQLFTNADSTWVKVKDRFIPVHITLPDNIAFNLIGHAFSVKSAAKESGQWDLYADDLNSRLDKSRTEVMKVANITDPQVMKDIMPLHPMAALILKNIAVAFKSNQRSMFDFIKSPFTDDVRAFQWFIENTGPLDDHPLLTVDMLWNFFYEKGRDNLTSGIRLILDTYPQQQHLRDDEKAVLKSILIMQAIDQQLAGEFEIFKATDQNISYMFEGITDLDSSCKNIAKALKEKGILVCHPINGGRHVYAAAVLAGDQAKIDSFKKSVLQNSTTSKLVAEGSLSTVLSLSPALKMRFESEPNTGKLITVTPSDFTRTINMLKNNPNEWHFNAVLAFAKDEVEAVTFRKTIKAAVSDVQYEHIIFIDALASPLGAESLEQYVDYSAMAMYYNGNNNTSSRESSDKARRVLELEWKNSIYNGQFIIYTYAKQEGEKFGNAQGVSSHLQSLVMAKHPCVFDFTKNLTENQLKLTNAASAAKCGIVQNTSGVVSGIEKNILSQVWQVDKYWKNPATSTLIISKIKVQLDNFIEKAFNREGQVSIGEIYDFIQKAYGFAPCNLSAFITGFLLKEYSGEPYRYSDQFGGHDSMTSDKLKEMLGNYIGKNPKPTYIIKMTPEEMAFYDLTEKVWKISKNSCSSASQATIAISSKMRDLGLPIWCLKEIDNEGIFDLVQMYIDLVQKEGPEAHKQILEIGKKTISKTNIAESLTNLISNENCQNGMREFLKSFEGGILLSLANEIGAQNILLSDIRALFTVKHACLWDKKTGEDEIRKLIVEYGIVKESNLLLSSDAHSYSEIVTDWGERLKFLGISAEHLKNKYPSLSIVFDTLVKIYHQTDLLPEQSKIFYLELVENISGIRNLLDNDKSIFAEVYSSYLEDFSDLDIIEIKSKIPTGMFQLSKSDSNIKVKNFAENFRKEQLKTQLYKLWKDKTGTKNPLEWSATYRTPILCCVHEQEFEQAKKTFETLNRKSSTDAEIIEAISFINSTELFDVSSDTFKRNAAFINTIIGDYHPLLIHIDTVRDSLEKMAIDTYNWFGNPSINKRIKQLAEAEYYSGGSDNAISKIDKMEDSQLKMYLKRLVKDNMTVGIEIISNGGNKDAY